MKSMLFITAVIAVIGWITINDCEAGIPEMKKATPYEGALYVPFVADDQIKHTDNVNVEYGNYEFWGATNGKVSVADKSKRGVLVSMPFNVCNHNVDWTKLEWNGQGEVRFWVRATVDNGQSRGFPDQNAWTDWTELGSRKSMLIPDEFDGKQFIQFKMELAGEAVVNEVRVYRLIMVPDHPRMFINREQLEKARKAIENDPFKKDLFEQFKAYMDIQVVGQKFQRERGLWHIGGVGAALGMLYQLTGDRKYAEEARIQLLRLSGTVEVGGETIEALKYSQQREFDYSEVAREMPIVYDLIADALTPAEREKIGEELARIADFVEKTTRRYRFPDLCNQVYVKNVTAMMAGIALYGDGVADEKAARWMEYVDRNLYERLIPASNFWAADDGGWGEGPGYANFTAHRFMQEIQSWRMATGENLFETANFFRYLTQWYLWITRPHNGRTVKFNDSSGSQPTLSHPSLLASLYGDEHAQYFANRYIQRAKANPTGYVNMGLWCPIVYYDASLKALEPEYPEQPSARHFEGVGQVVFRSSWDEDATFAVLKCQSFHSFGHRHADENEFLIDKMGSLAIESGVDQRSPGSHVRNYFTRTIAHNTVTVKDPNEDTGKAANGGGQYQGEWRTIKSWRPVSSQHGAYNAGSPLWLNGGIVAFETTEHYDYVVGDATGAYSSHKVDLFTRQVIYLKPNLFVMFDRVTSDRPEFAKRWLLHTINKPNIDGNTTTITESKGKLIVTTLLPQDAELGLVGGSGRAFWVDGENYPPPEPEKAFEPGGWRLEVRPDNPRKEDRFLHVLYATAEDNTDLPDAKLVGDTSVTIAYEGKQATVTFAAAGEVAGHIVIKEDGKTLVDKDLTQKETKMDNNRIQICRDNPRYWQYKDNPVLLLGGSVEDNLFQIPNLEEQLDLLKSVGGNYVRCTMSGRDRGDVWPFKKTGDLYDLGQWDEEYWRRFENFLKLTDERDVIVQIEIWATYDFARRWRRHPFHPNKNVNYTIEESGLSEQINDRPGYCENDFFWSVPAAKNLQTVLKYQQGFVDKMLSYSLKFGNVLYCMDNETSVTPEWGKYWSEYVKSKAEKAGVTVHTTEMWYDHLDKDPPIPHATFDDPETYSFVDISQNNHKRGQRHWDSVRLQLSRVDDHVRPLTNVKMYGADTGPERWFRADVDGVERFWRNIFAGTSSARFHRPSAGLGLTEKAQANIRSMRMLTDEMDVFTCAAHNDLLSDRNPNEAYCMANPGEEYAVYFPSGGEVTLDVSSLKEPAKVRWLDISASKWEKPEIFKSGKSVTLRPPGDGSWVVLVAEE